MSFFNPARDSVNARFYGGPVKASEILLGSRPRPPAAATLYKALSVLYDKIKKETTCLQFLAGDEASAHLAGHCHIKQMYLEPQNHSVNVVNMAAFGEKRKGIHLFSWCAKVNSE